VGAQAPIAFIIAFVPMLFIAFAYRELNNEIPDCGTTFTWGTKAFGPWVGWMGGWGVAIAGMVVLANLAQIGSIYFWALFGMELENNDWRIILVAVLFIAAMTWVSWRGVEIGERIQNVCSACSTRSRDLRGRGAVAVLRGHPAPTPFDWNWLNRSRSPTTTVSPRPCCSPCSSTGAGTRASPSTRRPRTPSASRARGAADHRHPAVHLRLGHDRRHDVRGPRRGRAGPGNPDNADDFFLAIKDGLLGPWGWLLVVAVLISAVSSTQTTILPTARGTLAMGVYRALPARFKDVHPVYKTPSFSTIVGGTVAICYYLGMTLISDNILQDSISSLGLAIAFYYAITGYACVWYFRRDLATRARAVGQGHLPAARRPHADLRLRAVGHRHVRRRLRQHGAARHRRHLRRRHRSAARRRRADVRLVPLPALEAVLPGALLNRETPVLVPEEPGDIIRSIDGGI
jgi:hypothetical protein